MPRTLTREYKPVPLPDYERLPIAEMRRRADVFLAGIRRRHTVRECANHQPWHFAVISDPVRKARIRKVAEEEEARFYGGGEEWLEALRPLGTDAQKPFLEIAPWLICIFGARKSASADPILRKNYYVPESVGIATGFLIAALHQAGLATLTHTPSPLGFLNDICGRPKTEKPYILLVVGYPAADARIPLHATEKKPLDEIATFL